jgi:hypothetical protein
MWQPLRQPHHLTRLLRRGHVRRVTGEYQASMMGVEQGDTFTVTRTLHGIDDHISACADHLLLLQQPYLQFSSEVSYFKRYSTESSR